jgi:hypothetical protein
VYWIDLLAQMLPILSLGMLFQKRAKMLPSFTCATVQPPEVTAEAVAMNDARSANVIFMVN